MKKIAVSFFMAITLLGTIMLRSASTVHLPSQSGYANQENVIWYISIHIGMMMAFFLLNAFTKRFFYGLTALSSLLVVMLDMYGYPTIHNLSTAILFGLSSYCLVAYSNVILRKAYFITCLLLGLAFGTVVALRGSLPFDIYEIETVIEWSFASMLLIDLFIFKKNTI
tara:strand:- start:9145 stop:9648 length:504 start_codon:yes stop_codon:yes gene_type:complete